MLNYPKHMELSLLTAGGKISCLRCTAKSTRTKLQCGRPALKASKTQKCQFHGGNSTGPKTEQGRSRIAQANLKHGRDTRASIQKSSQVKAKLRQLEDIMYLYGMTTAPKTRGRKPLGYIPVRTKEQARQLMLQLKLGDQIRSNVGRG
jgi:hypothetical protein